MELRYKRLESWDLTYYLIPTSNMSKPAIDLTQTLLVVSLHSPFLHYYFLT